MIKYYVWKNAAGWFVSLYISKDNTLLIAEELDREEAMVMCNNLNKMLEGNLL